MPANGATTTPPPHGSPVAARTDRSETVSMWSQNSPRLPSFSRITSLTGNARYGRRMPERPLGMPQPYPDAGTTPATRIATLVGADGALGATALLLEVPGLDIVEASSVAELLSLVRAGGIAAVVVDPDLGQVWTVDTAQQVVTGVGDLAPVTL